MTTAGVSRPLLTKIRHNILGLYKMCATIVAYLSGKLSAGRVLSMVVAVRALMSGAHNQLIAVRLNSDLIGQVLAQVK